VNRIVAFIAVSVLFVGVQFGFAGEPLILIVKQTGLNSYKVALGEQLFHDPGLSPDGSVSCASCHDLSSGGDDGLRHSLGINNQEGEINAPTVFNSALSFRQFWNGRAATVEDQVNGPLTNPKERGSSWSIVLAFLGADEGY
jgi:cytochrome c peroxidase